MKKYTIMIESAGGVKKELVTGFNCFEDAYDVYCNITDNDGYFIDENGFRWDCYIEE